MIERTSLRRALAVALAATALSTTPAFAQDATAPQTTTPPAAAPTATPAPTPAPEPSAAPTQSSTPDAAAQDLANRSAAAAAGSTPDANAAEPSAAPARPRAARSAPRPAPRAARANATPQAAAPTPTPTPAPSASPSASPSPAATASPAPEASTPPAAEPSPTPSPTATTETTQTSETGLAGVPLWAWIVGAVVILGLIGFFAMRRREPEDNYVQPALAPRPPLPPAPPLEPAAPVTPVAPVAVAAAPVVAEELADVPPPAIAEDASIAEPEAADVEGLTAVTPPVEDRPWLEFAMRPVRAGTNVDEALVEFELTVGNAGNLDAEDVRVATFMLPAGADAEIDRVLRQPPAEAVVDPLTIAAGEGTRIDGTLALPRADLNAATAGDSFMPVVVADVRYRCPDGGEGRTSAAFVIGGVGEDGGTLQPFGLDQPQMREDIQAQLYRDPVRA